MIRHFLAAFSLAVFTPYVAAQTTYTWTGSGGNSLLLNAANWNPTSGPPGSSSITTNTDIAVFGNAGTIVGGEAGSGNYYLGAFVTAAGSSGPLLDVLLPTNTTIVLNGGYTLGSFTNVVAAAQGRNLRLYEPTGTINHGTPGAPTTLYAGSGRTLTLQANNLNAIGSATNIEGSGRVLLLGNFNGGGTNVAVNGGVLAFKGNVNGVANINVANGAKLQGGVAAGDQQAVGTVNFANNAGIRVLVNGSGVSPSTLINGTFNKGTGEVFRIQISRDIDAGLALGTYTPGAPILIGAITGTSFNGFDIDGTYTFAQPGSFVVEGNGFLVGDWSVQVSGNQVILNSYSVVPEPASTLALAAAGCGLTGWVARRRNRRGEQNASLSA